MPNENGKRPYPITIDNIIQKGQKRMKTGKTSFNLVVFFNIFFQKIEIFPKNRYSA